MDFLENTQLASKVKAWISALGVDSQASCRLRNPALIVVDMQKDFLLPNGVLKVWGGPAVVENIRGLIDVFHAIKRPVIFSRHIYENPETDGGATARWWKLDQSSQLLREGTWHAELADAFTPAPQDKVIPKRRYSAFYGTDLELLLRTNGVTEVLISGVCTNICCEATAHDAFFRDFEVYFVLDGTGATDETEHLATLRNISLAYGKIITTQQAIYSLTEITYE
jgi:nicotinamidase-related amidase